MNGFLPPSSEARYSAYSPRSSWPSATVPSGDIASITACSSAAGVSSTSTLSSCSASKHIFCAYSWALGVDPRALEPRRLGGRRLVRELEEADGVVPHRRRQQPAQLVAPLDRALAVRRHRLQRLEQRRRLPRAEPRHVLQPVRVVRVEERAAEIEAACADRVDHLERERALDVVVGRLADQRVERQRRERAAARARRCGRARRAGPAPSAPSTPRCAARARGRHRRHRGGRRRPVAVAARQRIEIPLVVASESGLGQ